MPNRDQASFDAGAAEHAPVQPNRFETLDGMRGIAAFVVILGHFSLFHAPMWIPHLAYLAVDLFFVLSGFVLAYNYDKQFADGLKPSKFMLMRARRLFPLFYIGLLVSVFTIPMLHMGDPLRWCVTLLANLLLLPGAYPGYLFPLDVPAWSLFFEFWVANLSFALCWRWLHGRRLIAFLCLSYLGIVASVLHTGWLNLGGYYSNLLYGVPRTFFSFFAGVWVARHYWRHKPKFRIPQELIGLAMLAVFCDNFRPRATSVQLLSVLILFPALVYFGAIAEKKHSFIMEWLGDASYGAYTLHWPILIGLSTLILSRHWTVNWELEFAFAIFMMILAHVAHRFLDVPIRSWVARKWPLKRRSYARTLVA